jgi:hypothetical protein
MDSWHFEGIGRKSLTLSPHSVVAAPWGGRGGGADMSSLEYHGVTTLSLGGKQVTGHSREAGTCPLSPFMQTNLLQEATNFK